MEKMENQQTKIDLRKALDVDLTASISLLSMIKDDPQLFERVLTILEEYQEQIINNQKQLDELE